MRVLIDATPLLLRSSGVKNYVYYWIRSLQQLAGDRVAAFPFLDPLGELNHEASITGFWQTWARLGLVLSSNYAPFPLLNAATSRADVFHMSNILIRRPPTNTRRTATMHDMTCWLMPEFHTRANVRAAKEFAERVVRRADGLIAVSECTRQDAVRLLGIDPKKIEVIYSGVAGAFFEVSENQIAQARSRYGLTRAYALFVGTIEPRKNLPALLDAWRQTSSSLRDEFELVLAGPLGWGDTSAAAEARYLGYVPEPDLPGLTAGAAVFVYPSLYEGFGFPVAQAMAAGVPVVTSNLSSLPEITGAAAVLVDPRSPAEIAAALERVLTSRSLSDELRRSGAERARRFRWEECARQSLAFFERIA
jgi:glycosyltransferase involved in cell wall biosynthesis